MSIKYFSFLSLFLWPDKCFGLSAFFLKRWLDQGIYTEISDRLRRLFFLNVLGWTPCKTKTRNFVSSYTLQ